MEDIAEADYTYEKQFCNNFEIKSLGEYHNLYVQSHTLLLADVFENFRNMCLKIYKIDPPKLFISYWISMASNFKNNLSKVRSFN